MRWILATTVIVVAGSAIVWIANSYSGAIKFKSANTEHSTATLQTAVVAALGRVEPQSEVINISSGVVDRLESLLVRRGEIVKKDQVIGRLHGYSEQVAERDQIVAQLAEAKVKLGAEIALSVAKIESAEIKLHQTLEVSPLRIAAQEATIASIEAALSNNRAILKAEVELLSRNISSQRNHDNQKSLVLQSEANLLVAQSRLGEIRRQYEFDRLDAESQIRMAQASLERAKADFAIESLSKQLATAEARVRRMTISAPIDGRILNVMVRPGEQVGSTPILSMGNTDRMRVVAEVYETDITRVNIGQRATIASRALPESITGTVVEIGNLIFKNDILNVDPAAKADARVVEVRIDVDEPERVERLTNLTVEVKIQTPSKAGAFVGDTIRK